MCLTNRYYDPATARFLTRDPIGYEGGINLYGFCAGNPINNTDPFGTNPLAQWIVNNVANSRVGQRVVQWAGQQGGRIAQAIGQAGQRFGTWGQSLQRSGATTTAQRVTRWQSRLGGVTLRKISGAYVKKVDPNASKIGRWYGRLTIKQQAKALEKLGDMAPRFRYNNDTLIMQDVGKFQGSLTSLEFWSIKLQGSIRLGTPFNDIWPRNIGSSGQIFDPVLQPGGEAVYWGGLTLIGGTAGGIGYYYWQASQVEE